MPPILVFPPAPHRGVDLQMPGGFCHAVALLRYETDGFLIIVPMQATDP